MKQIPGELLADLKAINGFDEKAFLDAHNHSAVTSIRLHPKKNAPAIQYASPVPWCSEGLYLKDRPIFTLDPLFHAGAYYVQEASSMFLDYLVRQVLPVQKNLRVLDLCAAPGGKSTLLASLLDQSSLLISNEVIRSRASILEENVVRWGYPNNWVTSNDPRDFASLSGYFDLVVVDAPCSGSGLFRKDERALSEWSVANVALCSQRQQRILADIWSTLKDDGFLVYATCSYSLQEDEMILDWLSDTFPVSSISLDVPAEWGITPVVSKSGITGYRFFPDKVNGEGFFIAVVRKNEATSGIKQSKYKSLHDRRTAAQSSYLLEGEEQFSVIATKEGFAALYAEHEADFQLLNKSLYLRKTGVALGTPANKGWLPAHDVALSINRSWDIPCVDLNREQALKFLKKEDINISPDEKGWLLATFNGLGLGWLKALGNRTNNYLPKNWRIRMELPSEWD